MFGCMKYISLISRCSIQHQGEKFSAIGLKGNQCGYLFQVCREPGLSQDQLSQRLHVNRSNVTRQLVMLEKNGFVERRKDPGDARILSVHPTQKALDNIGLIRKTLHEYSDFLTEDFTPEEKAQFIGFLERAASRADEGVKR